MASDIFGKKLFEEGLAARKAWMGEAYVERAFANADADFDLPVQEFVTATAWGRVWSQSVLPRKNISLQTLCLLAALNRPTDFETHFRAARRNGCTVEELRDTLLQITAYCGAPAGLEAFRIGKKVLAEEKAAEAGKAATQPKP